MLGLLGAKGELDPLGGANQKGGAQYSWTPTLSFWTRIGIGSRSRRWLEEVNMNTQFHMKVFSRRWGHEDKYEVKRTDTAWNFRHDERGGDSDK